MGNKTLKILFTLILILSMFSFGYSQRRTGALRGTITDEEGSPLQGVMVSITSPSQMGTLSFMTTKEGDYRFPAISPGTYSLKAELSGFQTIERTGVIIYLGTTIDVDIVMKVRTLEEAITVIAPSPLVDMKSSKLSMPITRETIETAPLQRDLWYIVQTAPGTIPEGSSYRRMVSVHGGTSYDNVNALEGINVNEPGGNFATVVLPFEALEEVEIITGGAGAEYSQVASGYFNFLTKSGGNKFSGSLSTEYSNKSLQQSVVPTHTIESLGLVTPIFSNYIYEVSATFGGPIYKDKLWFFLAPQFRKFDQDSRFIPFTDPFGNFLDRYNYYDKKYTLLAKLSAQIKDNIRYVGLWQYYAEREDPTDYYVNLWNRPYTAAKHRNRDQHVFSNVLTLTIQKDTFVEFHGGYYYKGAMYYNNTAETEPIVYDRYTGYYSRSSGSNEYYPYQKKTNLAVDITRFQDDFLGASHEFKAGVEVEFKSRAWEYPYENPYRQYYYNGLPWYYHNTTPYRGRVVLRNYGRGPGDYYMKMGGWRGDFYIQDNLTFGRLSLNLGLRYSRASNSQDAQTMTGWVDDFYNGLANLLAPELFPTEDITFDAIKNFYVWKKLQPRIGVTFDLFGNGKTALKASWGIYAMSQAGHMPQHFRAFGGYAYFYWYDDNKNAIYDLPPIDRYSATSIARMTYDTKEVTDHIDPNTSAPYLEGITAGIEHELFNNFNLSLNFIYKEHKNQHGYYDKANPLDGDMWLPYSVTDPGDDGKFDTGDDQNLTVYALKSTAESPYDYSTNVKEFRRKYWAFELTAFKRMSNNWHLSASVTYSKMYGNMGAQYGDTWNYSFQDKNDTVNLWGRSNMDRPLVVKLLGSVILPYEISLSAFITHYDGQPFNRTLTVYFPTTVNGFARKYSNVTVRAEPLGSKRYQGRDIFDIRVEKKFNIGPGRLGIFLDVLNVFGDSVITIDEDNGGYIYADGTFERYSLYGKNTAVDGVRMAKLSLRFTF